MKKSLIISSIIAGTVAGTVGYKFRIRKRHQNDIHNKRVLILVNHDVVIYNFRLELVERLISEGYEVHISSPAGEHTADLKTLGAHFHEITFDRHGMNPIDEIKLLRYYKQLMRAVDPLIVFTYTVKCNIYGGMAARSLSIPFCSNITGLGMTLNGGGIREKAVLSLYKVGLRGAQKVFFQNKENKDFMVSKRVINSPYTVLPGSGVNLVRHSFEPYPEPEKPLMISYIGRIMKDKGTDELLCAAEKIKEKYPAVIFRLIGFFDDDYEGKIRKAEKKGIIEYVEQQREVHPWIKEAHAIIHPSYHEGMSNVLLEAAATGRPVLASDIPGCRETFDEGVSGFGFKPRDIDGLLKTIERFICLPYENKVAMGIAGRARMEKLFSRDIVVSKYMDEIHKIPVISS